MPPSSRFPLSWVHQRPASTIRWALLMVRKLEGSLGHRRRDRDCWEALSAHRVWLGTCPEGPVRIRALTLQPLLFWKKSKGNPEKKTRVFLFAETLKSLEKKGKTHQKSKENRKTCLPRGKKKVAGQFLVPVLPLNYPHHEGILGTIWGTIFGPQIAYLQGLKTTWRDNLRDNFREDKS